MIGSLNTGPTNQRNLRSNEEVFEMKSKLPNPFVMQNHTKKLSQECFSGWRGRTCKRTNRHDGLINYIYAKNIKIRYGDVFWSEIKNTGFSSPFWMWLKQARRLSNADMWRQGRTGGNDRPMENNPINTKLSWKLFQESLFSRLLAQLQNQTGAAVPACEVHTKFRGAHNIFYRGMSKKPFPQLGTKKKRPHQDKMILP